MNILECSVLMSDCQKKNIWRSEHLDIVPYRVKIICSCLTPIITSKSCMHQIVKSSIYLSFLLFLRHTSWYLKKKILSTMQKGGDKQNINHSIQCAAYPWNNIKQSIKLFLSFMYCSKQYSSNWKCSQPWSCFVISYLLQR